MKEFLNKCIEGLQSNTGITSCLLNFGRFSDNLDVTRAFQEHLLANMPYLRNLQIIGDEQCDDFEFLKLPTELKNLEISKL